MSEVLLYLKASHSTLDTRHSTLDSRPSTHTLAEPAYSTHTPLLSTRVARRGRYRGTSLIRPPPPLRAPIGP